MCSFHIRAARSGAAAPQALVAVLLRASLHAYAAVRDAAAARLAGACKRAPCLAPPCLPHFLAALAGLPLPSDEVLAASLGLPDASLMHGAEAPGGSRGGREAGGMEERTSDGRSGLGLGSGSPAACEAPLVPDALLGQLRAATGRPAVRTAAGDTTAAGALHALCEQCCSII